MCFILKGINVYDFSLLSTILARAALILTYVAGVGVAIALMRQRRDSAPLLALAGFVLLLGIGILNSIIPMIIERIIATGTAGVPIGSVIALVTMLSNMASAVAMALLVMALWFGMRRA
jgi:hypothetical protein